MKKVLIIGLILGIFLVSVISAAGFSACCEKTLDGAWCQNAPEEQCDQNFRSVPTSCDATAYCKMGTCVNIKEGECMENTPQKVCQDNDGVWEEAEPDALPQCQLGCCLMGDQASFVTQTRCKRLAGVYGLEIDFRSGIQNEVQCIISATSDVKGACIFEQEFESTCSFITKRECMDMEIAGTETSFREGFLCSAHQLNTNCAPTKETTCVEGRDEVFFVDSCGNVANIYDASKQNSQEYWSEVKGKVESCGLGLSNADSQDCGNCDYYLGSTCKAFKRSEDKSRPDFGDNICRDLSCSYEGKTYEHGETWCSNSEGAEENLPGSKYFRTVCYNGDVTVEPCADFRQETCIESDVNGFTNAACVVNKWQDCSGQTEQDDCENTDRRDCQWIPEIEIKENVAGFCVPSAHPGFNFWEIEGSAGATCSQANKECLVTYEAKLGGDRECVLGCECLEDDWEDTMNNVCSGIGDCGSSLNYIGVQGFDNGSAVTVTSVGEEEDE